MSAKLYTPGDKVRVRSDLCAYKDYGGFYFVPAMEEWLGKIVTIKTVEPPLHFREDDYFSHNGFYLIKKTIYRWTDQMFEPINALDISANEFLDFLDG